MPGPTSALAHDSEAFRLPRTVEPETYRIEIEPNVSSATFSGTVAIDIVIVETVHQIVLERGRARRERRGRQHRRRQHRAVYRELRRRPRAGDLPSGLGAGDRARAPLSCRFTGTLNDKLRGFYRSTFTGVDGEVQTIATTQFESVDARRCFPCFDEPDRKAVFDVALIVEPGVEAISNSPVVGIDPVGEKRRIRFSPTMKMSTYLVAFVVGKLETSRTVDVDGVPLRVVCTPGKVGLADFALEVGAFALRFFTDYFNIPYPGDKVDLVAIPDFAAGAMENLGCITFRDTALLIDKERAARTELERVADVIAHELAHMWFGDLVTMRWWEGIWLNEAFATFMETLCVDAFRPSWERWVSFAPSREAALAVDAVHSTRPIEYPVGPPKEAEGMFDLLTYEKGCGVLRMLEQYIGADVFRDGVRTYLKAHAYANTVTSDLWDALEDASGAPVRDVMDTFILQGGHPLVSLEDDTLTQQPFALGPVPAGTTSSIGSAWRVPVAVRALPGAAKAGALRRGTSCSGSNRLASRRPDRGLAVVNAGGWGMFRDRLRDRAPARAGRPDGPAGGARTSQPLGRHLGHDAGRVARTSRSSSRWPRASDSSRTRRPGRRSAPHWAWPTASPPTLTATPCITRWPHWSARSSGTWASTPPPARGSGRRRCARWPSTSWAPSGRTPPCGPRRLGASTRRPSAGALAPPSPPTSRPPPSPWWPSWFAPPTMRPSWSVTALRPRHRRRCARSARWPSSPTSTCACAPSTWP